jgi:Spy/CpxP family protein refolding chaperone
MRGRAALLAALTLAAVFVAGAAVGAAVERARAPEPAPLAGPPPEGRPPIFAGPMGERLGLTARQRDSIQRIVERDRVRADTLYREFRPRLRARFDSTTAAVEAVLTPEQRAEWRRIREERGRWRAERRSRELREPGTRPRRRMEGAERGPGVQL